MAPPTPGPHAAEWAQRAALLEKARGQLTLSKAIAILLNMVSGDELGLLVAFEQQTKTRPWQSAYAIGTDKNGTLIWGGGYGWRLPTHASDTAREQCARGAGDTCQVVMVNGELREREFLEMAKGLGVQGVAAVREAFVAGLRNSPAPVQLQEIGRASCRERVYVLV